MAGFRARFHGTCGETLDEIVPGDVIEKHIARRGSRANGYAHVGCLLARPTVGARIKRVDDDEYRAGVEDVDRWRFVRDMLGEDTANAMEYDRDIRGLNGDW